MDNPSSTPRTTGTKSSLRLTATASSKPLVRPNNFWTYGGEGIGMSPDGRSFVTSAGMRQSTVWVHDKEGERQVSSEGYCNSPFTLGEWDEGLPCPCTFRRLCGSMER